VRSLAIAAIGRDRPGIVASVSRVLLDLGCNVEDSSMTLLRGNFSMMLVIACPDDLAVDAARTALQPACDDLGLTFSVLEVDDRASVPEPTHVLTVYGGDKPGILHRTTELLASSGVNITDLNSRLVGDTPGSGDTPEPPRPVYALILELEVPAASDVADLDARLHAVASEIGVDLVLHEREADVL
jgi:glycine cleavage system transcriptional repressor